MKTNWVSLTGLSLTFLVAACSSTTSPGGTAGAGNGTAGAANGTAGTPNGTAGTPNSTAGTGNTTAGTGNATAGTPGTGGASASAGAPSSTAGSGNIAGAGPLPRLVTSAANAFWKTDGMLTEVTAGTPDVTVNDASAAQTWEGFGGAFNELGWKYLMMLSEPERIKALNLLFGDDGARFTLGRIPMGASDYAIARYTLNETANDTAMANFSIAQDKMFLLPYVKAAQAIRPGIHFWASPWTPPTWMKSAPFQAGNVSSPFDGGTMKSDDATLDALAKYFVKFVQEYGKEGVKIEAVAPQNEPNFGQNYPSCLWGTATFVNFVGKFLGPQMNTASPETAIMLGTMSNGDKDPAIVTAVLADATAKSFIKSIGMQWGMLGKEAAAKASGLPMWQTEHKCGNYPWVTASYKPSAPNDLAYGVESWGLIRDWIKAGVSTYSAWNMVLDPVGKGNDTTRDWAQNALLVVDGTKLTLTPTYHVFRHLSQFVEPGAKVVATTGGEALAFKNPGGKIVTVLYNSGAAKTAIVSAGGKMFSFAMPAAGWATVTTL
ncbi:MAG TPA: glycoside hydrolase family 30 beta sandwich domain-containing protein [Polyangiaceae bacterium]|nr:glycoside hydrolase family 30 beta sandwich domain-containing protein [Polyangiaceae bacterium]